MGIFDFLGDLSSKRSKELGLGGIQSLLGTRRAAQAGAIGDEMMGITNKDSLPGYFNEQTREYVPWYVDLFDGGGLNKSEGLLSDAQKATTAVDMLNTNGAPVQRAGQMAPGLGSQLSDMERMQRANPLEPFGGSGPTIQDTPDTSYYTPPSSMQMPTQTAPGLGSQLSNMESARLEEAKRRFEADRVSNTMSNIYDPRLKMESTGYGRSPYIFENYNRKTDLGAAGYGPMEQAPSSMQMPTQNDAEYQEFVKFLSDNGGFTRELQNPEWMQRAFNRYMQSRAN